MGWPRWAMAPFAWPGTEVGWALHPDAWGKGYALEAAVASLDYAFDVLGWSTVIHLVNPLNVRSRRVAERLGATLRGEARMPPPMDQELVDVWGQTRDEWRASDRGSVARGKHDAQIPAPRIDGLAGRGGNGGDTGGSHAARDPVDLLITRARVVDTRSGAITPGRVIAIRGDTIVAIGDSTEGSRFRARRIVDAAGRHVIPGLWDMHMHFGGGDTLIQENRVLLPLYLAHGVTAVRDAAGDLSSTVLAWRDSVARGSLEGPMIFTSGPKIEGKNSIWPGDTEVETQAGVDSALDNLQRLRVDFVKLTDNALKPDLFRYALGEIRRRGMKSSAHIPSGVPVREAVELGLGSIEHLSYAIRGASEGIPKAPGADNQPPSFDSANAVALYRFMAERGTAITPTLNISRTLAWLDSEDHTQG